MLNEDEKYNIGKLLKKIDSPSDLRKLDKNQLKQVCNELRQ